MAPQRFLWTLLGALLVWGILLAVGTILFPGRLAVYRALIIFSCTFVFVAFWGAMLLLRGSGSGKHSDSVNSPRRELDLGGTPTALRGREASTISSGN